MKTLSMILAAALGLLPSIAAAQTIAAPAVHAAAGSVAAAGAAPMAVAPAAGVASSLASPLALPAPAVRLVPTIPSASRKAGPNGHYRLVSLARGIARALAPSRRDAELAVRAGSLAAALEAPKAPSAPAEEHPLAAEVKERGAFIERYRAEFTKAIVGQEEMRDSILIGLLAGGHILLEGVPGLAKTRAVRAVTSMLELDGARIQFTRDLLPSDITGQEELDRKSGEWAFRKGRIFTNVLLADEINRAKGTTQGGLLEAMEEKQVTVAGVTYSLPDVFLVLATQNPIEEDGVHPLPKAQLDRFMFKVHVTYPSEKQLGDIVTLNLGQGEAKPVERVLTKEDLLAARETVSKIIVSDDIKAYIARLVTATNPQTTSVPEVKKSVRTGVSPRAAIWLARSAQVQAFLQGRHYVKPEDVRAVAHRVLRHRIILQFEAEGRTTADHVVADVVSQTPPVFAK